MIAIFKAIQTKKLLSMLREDLFERISKLNSVIISC